MIAIRKLKKAKYPTYVVMTAVMVLLRIFLCFEKNISLFEENVSVLLRIFLGFLRIFLCF